MPIDRTPWTDDTIMPWGAHKDVRLAAVPSTYLLWLLDQRWIADWPGLHAYLRSRETELRAAASKARAKEEPVEQGGYNSYEEFRQDFRGW